MRHFRLAHGGNGTEGTRDVKFLMAKCVWGAAYVRTMLTVNLPSLLAPGNLPALRDAGIEHALYTTPEDGAVIEAHPAYQALRRTIPCRIVRLDAPPPSKGDYFANIARMNQAHCRILETCEALSAVWLFDQPDHVWGDGSLRFLIDRARAGARCVMFAGVRTVLEDMIPALESWRSPDSTTLALTNRDLLRIALQCCHSHDAVRFWGMPIACTWPHHVNWRVTPDAFLRRAFFAQPFLMAAPGNGARPERSVDADYIHRAFPDMAGVEFVRDTDDFLVIEVSRRQLMPEYNPQPLTVPMIAAWATKNANSHHMDSFEHAIRFHADGVPERCWRHIERFAGTVAGTVRTMRTLHEVFAAIAGERPVLATLFGRLLRNPTVHARVQIPERFTLLLPDEEELALLLGENDDALARRAADHILPGDRTMVELLGEGEVLSIGGRCLTVRPVGGDAAVEGRRVTIRDGRLEGIRFHGITAPL